MANPMIIEVKVSELEPVTELFKVLCANMDQLPSAVIEAMQKLAKGKDDDSRKH